MVLDVFCGIFRRIPCQVKEKGDRIFHRLEVAHIQNPKTVHSVFVCKLHLLPKILYRSDVQPLGVTWSTYIIDMVVHSPSARMLAFLSIRKLADISPVVVRKKDGHIVRNPESLFIKGLDFLIKSPYLRTLAGRSSGNIPDDLALIVEDLLHHLDHVCIVRDEFVVVAFLASHGGIAVAAHTDGDKVFGIFSPLDAFTEELVDHLLVCSIIPCSIFIALPRPFLMVAGHWLMVGCTHDDTHLVGHLAVQRVVSIESPAPHRRPEEVSAETEDELEYALVEAVVTVIGAVGMLHPACEAWGFVIEEDAAVTHCGLAGSV